MQLKLMIDAAFEIEEYVQKMRDLMIEYSMWILQLQLYINMCITLDRH